MIIISNEKAYLAAFYLLINKVMKYYYFVRDMRLRYLGYGARCRPSRAALRRRRAGGCPPSGAAPVQTAASPLEGTAATSMERPTAINMACAASRDGGGSGPPTPSSAAWSSSTARRCYVT